jgi:hypothetical protein
MLLSLTDPLQLSLAPSDVTAVIAAAVASTTVTASRHELVQHPLHRTRSAESRPDIGSWGERITLALATLHAKLRELEAAGVWCPLRLQQQRLLR